MSRIAYHEAAHALVAHRLGYQVEGVSVNPVHDGGGGHCQLAEKPSPEDALVIYLAGAIAEEYAHD